MIEFLARTFIKNRESLDEPALRRAYGVLCSAVGIALTEAARVGFYHLFGMNLRQTAGIPMESLLTIAIPEAEYSALFLLPMFFLYAAIYHRFRTDTEL